jgi:hypothetical protein
MAEKALTAVVPLMPIGQSAWESKNGKRTKKEVNRVRTQHKIWKVNDNLFCA